MAGVEPIRVPKTPDSPAVQVGVDLGAGTVAGVPFYEEFDASALSVGLCRPVSSLWLDDSDLLFKDPVRASPLPEQQTSQSFRYGLALALGGDYETPRTLWEGEFNQLPEPSIELLMNLTWLALFFRQQQDLWFYAGSLADLDDNNYVANYALAWLAYRDKNYQMASFYLYKLSTGPCPDLWASQGRNLARWVDEKNPDLNAEGIFLDYDLTAFDTRHSDEINAHFAIDSYQTLAERVTADELFGSADVRDYESFAQTLDEALATVTANDFSSRLSQPEWLAHVFFRSQMTYVPALAVQDRSTADAFLWQEYDCTEYSESICRYLVERGTKAYVVGYRSTEDGVEHKFVAFERKGRWGSVSPMSYSEPNFTSLEAVCAAWEYDNMGTSFFVETWSQETRQSFHWGMI